MTDPVLMGLVAGQWGVIALLGKLLWDHSGECRSAREHAAVEYAKLHEMLLQVTREIGTHETGIRGSIHKINGILSPEYLRWQRDQERDRR